MFEPTIFAIASITSGFLAKAESGANKLDKPKIPNVDKYSLRVRLGEAACNLNEFIIDILLLIE
jgi:hypothetical protein